MKYIVDTCIWIDFFVRGQHKDALSSLLLDNLAYTNKAILSELIPAARMKNGNEFIECLSGLEQVPLIIDWDDISEIQYMCLKTGLNKIGLIDIIIAQNACQHNMSIFSTDKHIEMLSRIMFFDWMRWVHTLCTLSCASLWAFKKGMYPESNTLPKTTYPACGVDVDYRKE